MINYALIPNYSCPLGYRLTVIYILKLSELQANLKDPRTYLCWPRYAPLHGNNSEFGVKDVDLKMSCVSISVQRRSELFWY